MEITSATSVISQHVKVCVCVYVCLNFVYVVYLLQADMVEAEKLAAMGLEWRNVCETQLSVLHDAGYKACKYYGKT